MGRIMKRVLPCMAVLALVFALCAVSYAADWSGFPLQQEGARNDYVRALQTVAKYYNPSQINVDAVFGSGTKSAVINYQRNSGFAPSEQDGIVGAQTWNSIYSRLGSRTRITGGGTGNGTPSSSGMYYGYRLYQRASGSYTQLYYFRVDINHTNWFDVYVAAPGSTPGTWYWVNPRT